MFSKCEGILAIANSHYEISALQDYMLQKKYKDSGASKAKMKKTPTLAELKVSKQKKRVMDQRMLGFIRPSDGLSSGGQKILPSHRFHFITVL